MYLAAGDGGKVLFHLGPLEVTGALTTLWAIMAILVLFFWWATRDIKEMPETGKQNVVEYIVEIFIGFFEGIMGRERAVQFTPLLATFFILILVSNYSGLIPGAGHITGFIPPTSHWAVTGGLATVTFLTVQYSGIRKKGWGHFKHYFEPIYLTPIMLPLGIIEELIRPFSLSLRLFANVFGGEMVLFAIATAAYTMQPALYVLLPVVMGLELIFGFIQAFIFTLLSAVYIEAATAEGHH